MSTTQRAKPRDYWAFGLRVRSNLELPELVEAQSGSDPDVIIEQGEIPEAAETGTTRVGDGLALSVPHVARYRIECGRKIIVDAEPGVPERNVRLFLLGSAFGALLHQRGLLPLHANAIEIQDKAVAFMGEQGAGKSTLAAWFYDRGHGLLADDVCVIGFDSDGHALAYPGLPRMRLWADAIFASGREPHGYERSYVDDAYAKFDVPTIPLKLASSARELAGLYVLDRGEVFSIEPMKGIDAVEAVFANTYRGAYLAATGNRQEHWRSSTQLVLRVPVFRVRRPWSLDCLDELSRQIAGHAAHLCSTSHEPYP